MSPELIQKGIALTLITGGVGGGYFALIATGEGTLEQKRSKEKRELNTDKEWEKVVNEYKKDDNKELIDGVSNKGTKVKENLKKWCSSKGNTYFTGPTDTTYRSYYTWCLRDVTIAQELQRQGINLDSNHWNKKLDKYKKGAQNFILEASKGEKEEPKAVEINSLTEKHIQDWCTKNKDQKYKYLGDDTEYRVRTYCYLTKEEIAEANKIPSPKKPG